MSKTNGIVCPVISPHPFLPGYKILHLYFPPAVLMKVKNTQLLHGVKQHFLPWLPEMPTHSRQRSSSSNSRHVHMYALLTTLQQWEMLVKAETVFTAPISMLDFLISCWTDVSHTLSQTDVRPGEIWHHFYFRLCTWLGWLGDAGSLSNINLPTLLWET